MLLSSPPLSIIPLPLYSSPLQQKLCPPARLAAPHSINSPFSFASLSFASVNTVYGALILFLGTRKTERKKMKVSQKESQKIIWDHMRTASGNPITGGPGSQSTRTSTSSLPKLMIWLILFVSLTYVVYTLKLVSNSRAVICRLDQQPFPSDHHLIQNHTTTTTTTTALLASIPRRESQEQQQQETEDEEEDEESRKPTSIRHIVFGIAASAKLWEQRKNYIKIWYNKSQEMRGIVWLDDVIKQPKHHRHQQKEIQEEQVLDDDDEDSADSSLPPIKISGDTSKFAYTNKQGHRSAIRISRIVSETLRLGLPNVRWFVMGDDDTVFITENLVRVLRKYDHNQYYYIGSSSESHLQNIYFSYAMAYGGGGFAISYPLAKALDKIQDRCIQRYPGLYGSDDRMQACMAELGVPLTKEVGFHQYDVYGNLFGLLAAHPVTPLVSLHHLDVVEPIFPDVTRVQALRWLMTPMKMDSAGLMQQSICYDKSKRWTISVSWGFAVQIFRGVFSPREIEMPSRTFLNWYRRADYTAYAFNTRPVSRNPCQKPFVFYLSKATFNSTTNLTVTEYSRHHIPHPECKWKMADPAKVDTIVVHKKPDPHLWDKSPRRNCCRVKSRKKESTMIEVGVCKEGEVSEV